MRNTLLIILLLVGMPLHAELTLETIELQHRTAEEVINVLQPMVQNGGSLSGTGYKLFIKSTPENIEQLRSMISTIDIAPNQLLISVTMDRTVLTQNQQAAARVTINGKANVSIGERPSGPASADAHIETNNGNIKYDTRVSESRQTERTPQMQQVRVTEGLWATIKTGQAIPLATRSRNPDGTVTETVTYQAVATGFQVLPRINGDKVILTIRPQAQSPTPSSGGAYQTLEMESTVTGQVGKWLTLGSVEESHQSAGTGLTLSTQTRSKEYNQIFVKVDRLQE